MTTARLGRRVLVTGASGFVGTAVLRRLRDEPEFSSRAASRRTIPSVEAETVFVPEIAPDTDWSAALHKVDAVVHLAARVHVMSDSAEDPLAAFRHVNTAGTAHLARQAARAGVRRFVYVSSIKVNGENTLPGRPFTEKDKPVPVDPFGISKFEAELELQEISRHTGLEVAIIRPPLVYGPGVKANFRRMMQWVHRGVPLPLGAIENRRSLLALDNLVDLIISCIRHPSARNQTFLAGDGEDISTTELLRRLGEALGNPARLIPVPPVVLGLGFRIAHRHELEQRLCGSLQVDISRSRAILGWNPPLSLRAGLDRVAADFLQRSQ